MKEESLKSVSVLGTENNFTLIGDRVLILLDEIQGHTTTSSGIIVPLSKVVESDAGRAITETDERKHLAQGTVISIGTTASKKFEELSSPLSPGDRVFVHPTGTTKSHHFYPDRSKLVQDFNGYICVPHVLIEAKINKN